MNIKVTGKIEKPVEINPLDVIRELKLQLLGRNDYFIGEDEQVYYQEQCNLYGDYENVLAPQYIQENIEVVKALNVLANKLS